MRFKTKTGKGAPARPAVEAMSENNQVNVSSIYQKDADPQAAYICTRIEDQIAYYEAKSAHNKRLYYVMSAMSIVANALVPVFSVFLKTADGDEGIKVIITLLSSFSVVVTSLLVMFNAKELWSRYRSSASGLTSLLHQYYTRTGVFEELEDQAAFRLLAKLAESQFAEENKGWSEFLARGTKPDSGAR